MMKSGYFHEARGLGALTAGEIRQVQGQVSNALILWKCVVAIQRIAPDWRTGKLIRNRASHRESRFFQVSREI